MGKNTFRWRAFVSFLLLSSFLLSGISGVILFLRPEGSLAAWSGWSLLGLDKKGWETVHAVAIVYFLLGAGVHLAFNGRALLAYCRRGTGACRELALALLLSGLVLAAALGGWVPACWIIEMRAGFKSGAVAMNVPPPVVDAEQRTLAELCPLLGIDESRLLAIARGAGIRLESPAQSLAEVARKNGLSPEEVYILLGGKGTADPGEKRSATRKM